MFLIKGADFRSRGVGSRQRRKPRAALSNSRAPCAAWFEPRSAAIFALLSVAASRLAHHSKPGCCRGCSWLRTTTLPAALDRCADNQHRARSRRTSSRVNFSAQRQPIALYLTGHATGAFKERSTSRHRRYLSLSLSLCLSLNCLPPQEGFSSLCILSTH